MKIRLALIVAFTALMTLLLAACVAPPQQQAPAVPPVADAVPTTTSAVTTTIATTETETTPEAVPADWLTYANPVGFSIQYPPSWSEQELPQQTGDMYATATLQGTEGEVDLHWGAGFGGACPQGYSTVQVAQGELSTCYTKNADGTESWTQIYKELPTAGFGAEARTKNAEPASHDLVLQILSTLTFTTTTAMANPASENCIEQGGTLKIEARGDGGQFGVCYFEDNRQCEEWALLRGNCPVGGVKVTGYVTPAARYCAITGGTYAITGNSGQDDEQGACTFKDGSQCDAGAYYNGTCNPSAEPAPTATASATVTIQPLPAEVCNGQAQAMAQALGVMAATQSEAPLYDFVSNASGAGCEATVTGTGEQFDSPDAVVNTLSAMLEEEGWTQDPMLAAGGATGIGQGYRKGNQMCQASAVWQPDASANCPNDQPISACQVTPAQQNYTVTLNCGEEVPAGEATATITATEVITYTPGPPTGKPQEGDCWTTSLAVWRADAWRCNVGNGIYDPCFSQDDGVICGASPVTDTISFALTLTQPLPAPEVPADTAGHAWIVELADGTDCEFATGATGGVGDERINYFCPSTDPTQSVVILGDLRPGAVWMAKQAVLTGSMPDLTVVEASLVPLRTVWR